MKAIIFLFLPLQESEKPTAPFYFASFERSIGLYTDTILQEPREAMFSAHIHMKPLLLLQT